MIKVQDYLNELKAKREIGKEQFESLYAESKRSFDEITDKKGVSANAYLKYIRDMLINDKKNMKFYDIATALSGATSVLGVAGIFTGDVDKPEMLFGIAISAFASIWAARYAKSARDVYKYHRELLKGVVQERIEDHEKDVPMIRDVTEEDIEYEMPSIGGVEVSDEVLDVITTKISEDILSR
ncbi:MAG: hypothetical protein IJW59_05215 [Clostridia bacterium]|nr:hypothetical protein [Clostridia bacterium]